MIVGEARGAGGLHEAHSNPRTSDSGTLHSGPVKPRTQRFKDQRYDWINPVG